MDRVLLDVRHGARALRHSPGFTATASLTLAIGIGSATAAFTAFDAALLRPLPYPTSSRLAVVAEARRDREISVSYPDFLDWKASARSFESLASFRGLGVTLNGDVPEPAAAKVVDSALFQVLDTAPLLGRAFTPDDDRRGAPRTAILGYTMWQRRFGGDPGVIGRTMAIDGYPWEVVGVMPKGFAFPDGIIYGPADLYLSTGATWIDDFTVRDSHPGLAVVGLLNPGVSIAQAREEMRAIAANLAARYPGSNAEIGTLVNDAVSVMVGDLRGRLRSVTFAASLLLLIACANVAGLALTRALSRRRELMVRAALGETRGALARSLLAEHLILAALGAAGGVGLAFLFTRAMRPLVATLPRLEHLSPDLPALAFAMIVAIGAAVVIGLAPLAWLRPRTSASLGQRGQAAQGLRTRHLLVGAQLAVALVLLASALLFTTSFRRLAADTGGIDPHGTLSFRVALPDESYPEPRRVQFYRALHERLAALPGVEAVGAISTLPFSGAGAQSGMRPAGSDLAAQISIDVAVVTPGYFDAMGVPFVRGRNFTAADTADAPRVAVVDERFARRFWPDEDPIGRHLTGWGFDDVEVVGVVRHVDNYGVGAVSREEIFAPHAQRPVTHLYTIVRSTGDPAALAPAVRGAVGALDPGLPVSLVRTMRDLVDGTIAGPRLAATLSAVFGGVAALLAVVGLYGLVAYSVELRRREAAIRIALGAHPAGVARLIVRGVLGALAGGSLAGVMGAVLAGRWLQSELFGVSPTDPALLGAAAAGLIGAALAAGWIPARRAARVAPAMLLQEE